MNSETPETTITAPPFGDYLIRLLLAGPAAAGARPRDAATTAELRRAWGTFGENVPATWRTHASWLRQAAAERGIAPRFKGLFFAEAVMKGLDEHEHHTFTTFVALDLIRFGGQVS